MPDLTQINNAIIKAATDSRAAIQNVQNDLYIPDQNKHAIVQGKEAETRKAVRDLHAQARAEAASRRSQLHQTMEASFLPAGDAQAGIAADEQTWRRVKGLLDQGVAAPEIVADARNRGDRRTLKVLGQEYRAYQWGQTGNPADGDSLDSALSEARYATGPAEYRAAADAVAAVDRAEYAIDSNASSVEADLDPANTASGLSDVLLTTDHQVVQTEGDS